MALRDIPDHDDRPEVIALFANLKAALPQLQALLDKYNGDWEYEDRVYRFYHQSFKVYDLQVGTTSITEALQALAPGRKLHEWYAKSCPGDRQEVRARSQRPLAERDAPDRRGVFPRPLHAGDGGKYGKELERPPNPSERLGGVLYIRPSIGASPQSSLKGPRRPPRAVG